jgi:Gpi18-like mannosyltransferase
MAAMLAAGLAIRVAIAPHAGFYGDLRLFQEWAARLADVGPGSFYVEGQFADYPPGYLYILWLTGKISATPGYLLLKLPAILADVGLAWVAGTFAARLAPTSLRERWPVRALVTAAVLFNPAVIALSAVWGQVDAVPALFVLACLLLLFTGRRTLTHEVVGLLLFAVAVAMKPQSGFVLPVMLYALYRNHLHRRPLPELIDGALGVAVAGLLSLCLWAVSGLAFGLGPISLLDFYSKSAKVYPVTSANAFNLWGAVGFWRNDATGDRVVALAGIPAVRLGMLLYLVGAVAVIWLTHRAIRRGARESQASTLAAATLAVLAFAVLTRMHERYVFTALAMCAPLVFTRPMRLAYAGLSAVFVVNLWFPYAYFNAQWEDAGYAVDSLKAEPWFGWILGGFETDPWQKKAWSAAVVGIAGALFWLLVKARGDGRSDGQVRALQDRAGRASPDAEWRPTLHPRLQPAWHGAVASLDRGDGGKAGRVGPLLLVMLTCAFCLVILRGETTPAPTLNDSAFHLQMVRWADDQIGAGRVPLDGWYPNLTMGSSHFHHYQSLPHTLTASIARATGAGDQTVYLWILYLLIALWPIAVYAGARLFGWGGWTAAAAAAVSPLIVSAPGYGYEHASYTWQGYGVYSQLWAMWLLPLAWGLTWRAVQTGRYLAGAALALALTVACHFITGYLALLTLALWVVLGAGIARRIGRAALVGGGSLLVAAWVLVPLIGDREWTTKSAFYQGTIFNDSFGAQKALGWLFRGELFDNGRFPIVTILFFVGAAVCIARARTDGRSRALLGAFGLSLVLFFGRPTLGPVLDLLPGFGDVQIHRFVIGVDLAAILIAGVGLGWLLQAGATLAGRRAPRHAAIAGAVVAVAVTIGILAPAWLERSDYNARGADLIAVQRAAYETDGRDLDDLVSIVKTRADGRVYAGLRGNWGKDYVVGYVPVYAWLADRNVDAVGFTFRTIAALSTDLEASFDEANPAQYEMFNIKYVIAPRDRPTPVAAKLIASHGRHRLYEVQTTGYLQVADRSAPLAANRADLAAATADFRSSSLASQAIYPAIAFAGGTAPPATVDDAAPPIEPPGMVISQTAKPERGSFGATVQAERPAIVVLKSSFDPRWTATVDGSPAEPMMIAPSLVGVDVPAGQHTVAFRYEPYDRYPLLGGIGLVALLTLAGLGLLHRRSATTDTP